MWIPFRAIKRSVDAALEFEAAMNRIQAVTRSKDIEVAARRVAALSQTMSPTAAAERVYQEAIRGDWPSKHVPKEAEESE